MASEHQSVLRYKAKTARSWLILAMFVLFAWYLWMALFVWELTRRNGRVSITELMAPIAAPFFTLLCILIFAGILRSRYCALEISPNGLHDRNVTQRPIPWDDIADLLAIYSRGYVSSIEVKLFIGKTRGDYGFPRFTFFMSGWPGTAFEVFETGSGLKCSAGLVASEVNEYSHLPERLGLQLRGAI